MNPKLASLLLDLDGLSDEEAKKIVFDKYVELYLDSGVSPRRKGTKKTHDGLDCVFTESRFKHAFFRKEHYSKDKFDKSRGVRVAWIEQIVAGNIQKTECWRVPPKDVLRRSQPRPDNRLYLFPKENFVVWLEPEHYVVNNTTNKKQQKWWFSSAYVAGYGDIRRYCRAGALIWIQKISRD